MRAPSLRHSQSSRPGFPGSTGRGGRVSDNIWVWDNGSTTPNSTIRSANRRRFQRSWPSGTGLQARAMRWAPALSSSLRRRLNCARSNPSPAKRRLMRNTVPWDTSRACPALGAGQPSPVLNRMRARVATRAELLPARTMCSQLLALPGRQPNGKFLPDHDATSQQHALPPD